MVTLIERESKTEIKQGQDNHTDEKAEIDLMDILRKIIGIRKIIYKAAGIGLLIGVIVAISIPEKYTVGVTLSPEMGNTKGGGLSGLAASFLGSGVSMNEGTDALNASLSADIASSTPFLLELSKMKVPVSGSREISLSSYLDEESSPWWGYVIGFPSMVMSGVKSLFIKEDKKIVSNRVNQGIFELSRKELQKIETLKNMIIVTVDKNTSMTSVTVTLQNPKVAAIVADSVVECHGISIRREIIEYLITFILRLHRYMLEMIFRAHTRDDATYRIGLRPMAILGSNRIGSRCRKIKSGATSRLDSSAGSQGEYRG